jgi:hypothetical protein
LLLALLHVSLGTGTLLPCFTSTKVQILTLLRSQAAESLASSVKHFRRMLTYADVCRRRGRLRAASSSSAARAHPQCMPS